MSQPDFQSSAVESLLSLPRFGAGDPEARMVAVARSVRQEIEGEWLPGLDAIKITGSNGKGSASAMAATILSALGVSAGLYTSPHLFRVSERIRVDQEEITDRELEESAGWFEGFRARFEGERSEERFGAFEALTAVALRHFSLLRPETVVAEAGIGGRLDPARVFPGGVVGLTSVDLEHTDLLGRTEKEIALDKAALCPDGGVLVTGEIEDSLLGGVEKACRERQVRVVRASEEIRVGRVRMETERTVVDMSMDDVELPALEIALVGEHQVSNAKVAIVLVREWLSRNRPEIRLDSIEKAVRVGLREVSWPLRFERVGSNPEMFIDLAHTPKAVEALALTLEAVLSTKVPVLLVGVSEGRNPAELLAPLLERASSVICSRARHRGIAAEEIGAAVQARWPHLLSPPENDVEKALDLATRYAAETRAPLLVTGSFFLAVEVAEILRGGDAGALRFF